MKMRQSLKYIHQNYTDNLIGAEIGVKAGENASLMLSFMRLDRLYLIDHYDAHQEDSGEFVSVEEQEVFYKQMFERMDKFFDKTILVHHHSYVASKLFPDDFFDFVYIDAHHGYEEVKLDMELWLPKVKKVLCGHDFNNVSTPDVARAVRDFASKNELNLTVFNDLDWAINKEHN